jgi:nicotinamidase-related amidase
MTRRTLLALPALPLLAQSPGQLKVRRRIEAFKGAGAWRAVEFYEPIDPARTALILCDVWDRHWCQGATLRVNDLVKKMAPVVNAARGRGILIIHAPSDTMDFYRDSPQRAAAAAAPKAEPPPPLDVAAPPLPIDDSSGGCDTPGEKTFRAWTREHPGIPITGGDLITDRGDEVYAALKAHGINHLLIAGVHTNMCILNRSFAIKQMTRWGVPCILLRDLTDAMYDPRDRPYVSHEQGTQLVIEHIEKYWCPTALSADLLAAIA